MGSEACFLQGGEQMLADSCCPQASCLCLVDVSPSFMDSQKHNRPTLYWCTLRGQQKHIDDIRNFLLK